jgi:hypothetical protein
LMNDNDKAELEAVASSFDIKGRPGCDSCGDPVKIVFYDGVPHFAKHCKECFAELRYGKIPKLRGKRTF